MLPECVRLSCIPGGSREEAESDAPETLRGSPWAMRAGDVARIRCNYCI